MKKNNLPLIDASRPFEVEEMFFSTTDKRGVLTSWNDVFARVADYSADQLRSKPHNIVRHPHMPRCVFKLLWQYLESDRCIGAYVKNLARTGEYYWVFALASPSPDGYLSIRIKPTSELLPTIDQLYKDLLACESTHGEDWRAGMAASTELLIEKVNALGFADYDDFMTHALRTEFLARQDRLAERITRSGNSMAPIITECGQLQQLRGELDALNGFFRQFSGSMDLLSLNFATQASRLGDTGRALSVVSREIGGAVSAINSQVELTQSNGKSLSKALQKLTFLLSQAALQLEMAIVFTEERLKSSLSEGEQTLQFGRTLNLLQRELTDAAQASRSAALQELGQLKGSLNGFGNVIESLGKTMLHISVSYITGKTLIADLSEGTTFNSLLEELYQLSEKARAQVTLLSKKVAGSVRTVENWTVA